MIPVLISHGIHQQIDKRVYDSIMMQGDCQIYTALYGDGSNRPLYECIARNQLVEISMSLIWPYVVMMDHDCHLIYEKNFVAMKRFLELNTKYGGVLLKWFDKNGKTIGSDKGHKRVGCGMYRTNVFNKLNIRFKNMCVCDSVNECITNMGYQFGYIDFLSGSYRDLTKEAM